jgi:hypothetical protein
MVAMVLARLPIGNLMMLGGGTDRDAIKIFCKASPIRAFHVGRVARDGEKVDGAVLAEQVGELAELIE